MAPLNYGISTQVGARSVARTPGPPRPGAGSRRAASGYDEIVPELDWLQTHRAELIDELLAWVRIPSVAGADEHKGDLDRSAQWLAELLRSTGFPTVEIWQASSGPPAVFAEWQVAPDLPTVLVYSHHDVRAVAADDWRVTPPFTPVHRGSRVFGRGSSDAKGQVLAHVWGVRALLATTAVQQPPLNLKLLVEGEEETGSPGFAQLLRDKADRVAADFVVLSDTMTWAIDRPAICTGNRGMMKGQLEIRAATADLHAGAVAGGVPNASAELVRVLAQLHDDKGQVAIPGFYDDVAELPDAERRALTRLTADVEDWNRRTGTHGLGGEADRSLGERLYGRPALEVVALSAGDMTPPTTGTMPAVARATLEVSLVPDQDPRTITELLEAWFAEHVADAFEHELDINESINQPPYATPREHPALDVLAEAMTEAWGTEVGYMRNAGGAPTILLADSLNAPVAFFGIGLPEDAWHGPDESVDVDALVKGAATLALFWPRLARALTPRAS
jgi:acetylornithine deacetylase/succinyl-diaminopimelate desuccinylase-like protein